MFASVIGDTKYNQGIVLFEDFGAINQMYSLSIT